MRPVATDVAWFVCVSRLDTTVSPTKTEEPIDMPFRLWTWMGPKNHVLGGGPDPPQGKEQFGGGLFLPPLKCIVITCFL